MNKPENQQFVKNTFFKQANVRLTRLAGKFVSDVDAVIAEASAIFDEMLPNLAYVDKPQHPLAVATSAAASRNAWQRSARNGFGLSRSFPPKPLLVEKQTATLICRITECW